MTTEQQVIYDRHKEGSKNPETAHFYRNWPESLYEKVACIDSIHQVGDMIIYNVKGWSTDEIKVYLDFVNEWNEEL